MYGGSHSHVCNISCSQKPWKHNVSLLLVLVTKLLAISPLLLLAPCEHVERAEGDEQCDGRASADEDYTNPCKDLIHVVWAGHQGKSVALGDLPLRTARASQAGQIVVHQEVARLAKEEQGQTQSVNGEGARLRRGAERRIDLGSGHGTCHRPVEEGISEHVPYRHCGRGELVYESGLELPLDKVGHYTAESKLLAEAQWSIQGVRLGHEVLDERVHGRVEVGSQAEEERVEEQRAEVLDQEDGAPGELGPEILDEKLRVLERGEGGLAVLQGLLRRGIVEADAVVVGQADLASDGDLGIFNGCVGRQLEGGRQTLDGLLGSYFVVVRLRWGAREDQLSSYSADSTARIGPPSWMLRRLRQA